MNFELTNEQKDIKRAAREFAEKAFPEVAEECDLNETFPKALWKKACDLGFVGVFIDEVYGGPGLGLLENILIMEEFCRVDAGCASVILTTLGSEFILLYGREEQKKKYLPGLTKGEAIMGMAITEPDAGSDVAAVNTRALKVKDHYVINGNKMFITNGSIADFLVILCVTNEDERVRSKRHSALLVETNRKGFEANQLKRKLGMRASDTAEIHFSDVEVPLENLIGEVEGEGFYQLMAVFNRSRVTVAMISVGVSQGGLEKAISYAKQRKQFGTPLGSFQGIQFKLAEMASWIEASRALCYKAASMVDSGKVDPKLISMAKWFAGEVGVKVIDEVVQIHGGYGYLGEYGIERLYRNAKLAEIVEGTKEIEKMIIARELLGRG
ncbi:MAG TPA: acyl-CoA dehydrogenase family protein [Thermodesulfobacteriota bacterium]|nr:acyl-CoA dehydrogenase family protein [Thermodesulfobacteriota bacterium]